MREYTIKQAADLLHISKAGVRRRLQALDLMDRLTRDTGPQGRLLLDYDTLLLLDTDNVVTGNRLNQKPIEHLNQHSADTPQFDTGEPETVTDNREQPVTGQLPAEYADLLSTVTGLMRSVTTMQDTINRQSRTIEDLMQRIKEQEAKAQHPEQSQPADDCQDPGKPAGLWARIFGHK